MSERERLHSTIWKIAEDLRGRVDGWDFKNYVLGFLFYRFLSENFTEYVNARYLSGGDYAKYSDEEAKNGKEILIEEKGFFILPSHLFCNVLKAARQDEEYKNNLNEKLLEIFEQIEKSANASSENAFRGLFKDINLNHDNIGENIKDRNKKIYECLSRLASLELNYAHNA